MPTFRMTYEYPRLFHTLGRIEPGGTVEADENPDPHFFEAVDASQPSVTPVVTEASDATPETEID